MFRAKKLPKKSLKPTDKYGSNKKTARLKRAVSLSKNQNQPLGADFGAIFLFPATSASEKLLSSENRFFGGFQGHRGGIGEDRVQAENL